MTLCCDFLALRLALCGKGKEGYDFAAKRAALLQKHDGVQVHLLESIAAYFYALQGRPEQAPELFREHKLAEVSFFGPCRPMMSLIEQQVWLAQGEYVKVIAHSEGLLRRCEAMHYGLVGLQARIQLAAAQLRFGQRAEARATLAAALLDAVQDDFWVLFVEQYPALAPLLEGEDWAVCELRLGPFVARILPAGRAFAVRLGLPAPAPEQFIKTAKSAALLSERSTAQLRNFLFTVCGGMPQDYYLQAAEMQGIRLNVDDDILSVRLPALLLKKTRTEGFKFLQPAIHAALKQYAEQQNLPHFCECTICIEHIYDRCLPIKAVRDYDNLEMKEVLDIIALYCMTDDTGALCDQFQTTRFADSSCTIISVMQKEKFSAWLDKKNP